MGAGGSKAEAAPAAEGQTRAFVGYCDITESVRLYELYGSALSTAWETAIDGVFDRDPGRRLLKVEGDAMIYAAADASDAVDVATELAEALRAAIPGGGIAPLRLRSGIVEGPFWAGRHSLYGAAVNLAARLSDLALPGEVLLTEAVRVRLGARFDPGLVDRGNCYLRNVPEPVRVHQLSVGSASPGLPLMIPDTALKVLIAVLAPVPMGDPVADAPLMEAFADVVATELASVSGFGVISRLSVRRLMIGRTVDIDAARRELGASYVMSGRCQVAGGLLTAWLELSDTATGVVAWSERMTGSLDALLEEGSLRVAVVDRIVRAVLRGQHERALTQPLPTIENHTLMLAGVSLMHSLSQREFQRAHDLLQTLVRRASRNASPSAWLARWHVLRVLQGWSQSPEADTQMARDLCLRSLDADPGNALAHAMMGMVHTHLHRRLDLAAESYDAAIAANQSEPLGWLLRGALRSFTDDPHKAIDDVLQANALSPVDPQRYYFLALTAGAYLTSGDNARSLELAAESLRLNRRHLSSWRIKAVAEWRLGLEDAARATVAELLRIDPELTISRYLATIPSADHEIGRNVANALRAAGVPQ